MGIEINMAITTVFVKSPVSIETIPNALDPRVFRIPIPLILRSAVKVARPDKPSQEVTMASPAKYFERAATLFSAP